MELISREELLKQIETDSKGNEGQYGDEWLFIDTINSLPTVEEREEGEWIHDIHYGLKLPEHRCSICGEWEYSDTESKYCPNCGARMKGE